MDFGKVLWNGLYMNFKICIVYNYYVYKIFVVRSLHYLKKTYKDMF